MSEEPGLPPPLPRPDDTPNPGLLDRGRVVVIVGVFVVEIALFLFGVLVPVDASTRQALANQTSSQFSWLGTATPIQIWFYIFLHNLEIALIEMVPVLGAFTFLISIFSTGLATQAIVTSQSLPSSYGLILLALPYSIVELSAYAIATGSGIMLLVGWRRKRLRKELAVFRSEVLAVGAVLLTAAAMETVTKYSLLVGFALWLPVGLAAAGIVLLMNRRGR